MKSDLFKIKQRFRNLMSGELTISQYKTVTDWESANAFTSKMVQISLQQFTCVKDSITFVSKATCFIQIK